jgi:3-isopropylmalate/(R)-2-methylmalate dehydratase small subunit
MECFTRLTGRMASMPAANIDTDAIMPKAFLKGIDRTGLAKGLFHDLRFDEDGALRPDFVLNHAGMEGARFLIVGPNFGCGSSREHAVWGMLQYGIRAIVGTSFAGIFADNAANNGLLLITVEPATLASIAAKLADETGIVTIDLEQQRIDAGDVSVTFAIDPAIRRAMLLGLDHIGETLTLADAIRAFETLYLAENPWLIEEAAE